MITCECKKCGTHFKHSGGPIRCSKCGSREVWVIDGIGNVLVVMVLLSGILALGGFFLLPREIFGAEILALIVAIPVVYIRFLLWRKPSAR